jgi:dTDP-4-dehydrorhamnose 3,5-epimerase
MIIEKTEIKDLYTITLEPLTDKRGFFLRFFCLNEISTIKKDLNIVQINHTLTTEKGVVRGMHYQRPPFCETKIVRCLRGSVFDVAIDLRESSETYLMWHGEMLYLHSEFYNKEYEAGIKFNDPILGIKWPLALTDISERDQKHPLINSKFRGITI